MVQHPPGRRRETPHNAVAKAARKHVAGAGGIDGLDRKTLDLDHALAVVDHGPFRATGYGEAARVALDGL